MLSDYRKSGRAAFIPYIVAGYPSIAVTEKIIDALVEGGADLLELGVPFSDAMADGPVIQQASEKAARTVGIHDVLSLASRIHGKYPRLGLILFTYFNPVLK